MIKKDTEPGKTKVIPPEFRLSHSASFSKLVNVKTSKDAWRNFDIIFPGEKNKAIRAAHEMKYAAYLGMKFTPADAYIKAFMVEQKEKQYQGD